MKGIKFYFDNDMTQFVPGAKMKDIMKDDRKELGKVWISYGETYLINTKHVIEITEADEPVEDSEDEN